MNKIYRNFSLTTKLATLFLFAALLPVVVLSYFVYVTKDMTSYWKLMVGIGGLMIGYTIAAVYFLRNLSNGIKLIEKAAMDLSLGKVTPNGHAGNVPELTLIVNKICQVQHDMEVKTQFAEQVKAGNLASDYTPSHEQDHLGKALIAIKENLKDINQEEQKRKWASESLAKFVQILQSAQNLNALSNDIIINLVRTINANQGAIFILGEQNDKPILDMQACYAFNRSKHLTQKIAPGEGLLGQAFLEKETVYLKDVPDKFIRITSGLGEANPRYVLIVPLKMNDDVVGIIELASFKEFTPHVIEFVEKMGESIAHSISSFRIAENTKKLLEESKAQTEEMRAQEEELRQNQEELQATQEAISRKYDMLFKQLGELNNQSKFDQLKSITFTKKRNIEYYFDIIRNQILTFAENAMVIEATNAFGAAFFNIDVNLPFEKFKEIEKDVKSYYERDFIPKLNEYVSAELKSAVYIPKDTRTLILQHQYISNNPHPTGSKSLLNYVQEGGAYSSVHASYHSIFRSFLEKFGYYDIFLIDAATGDMLYSVFKEVDFATNLFHGLYAETNFGKVVKQAVESTDKNFVRLIDFAPYDPSYHAPASFIATAIYDGDNKIGILVFQMPINKINQILTGNNKWREDGLGESGETFMIGSDYKLRSIARRLIEDMDGHLLQLKKLNYSNPTLQQIRKMQTSILMEEVRTEGIGDALKGNAGTSLEFNSSGEKILNAYAPLNIPDVQWVIASTMKEEEASLRIKNLREENL
ncbi:GAF domain-containing protein [Chryseolinea sp. H1M3-3]|uniref:GAF domain-containing protein n=1 Tax=Chryseolinea sp. H1M3-3 TaxID=3034144 RepID=UPI0023ED812C|nr:GAF domain-containing protein [Chryseolinea sp. H1M3-3]